MSNKKIETNTTSPTIITLTLPDDEGRLQKEGTLLIQCKNKKTHPDWGVFWIHMA